MKKMHSYKNIYFFLKIFAAFRLPYTFDNIEKRRVSPPWVPTVCILHKKACIPLRKLFIENSFQ